MWLKPAKMASFDWAAPGKLLFFITQFSRGEKDRSIMAVSLQKTWEMDYLKQTKISQN